MATPPGRRAPAKPPGRRAPADRTAPPAVQPAAIAERGEHELTLDGVTYRLRPSRKAIRTIEKRTDLSLLRIIERARVGGLTTDELGAIAGELIRAGAEDHNTAHVHDDVIGDLIYEQGVAKPTMVLLLCLVDAANGGRDAEGNAKAVPS